MQVYTLILFCLSLPQLCWSPYCLVYRLGSGIESIVQFSVLRGIKAAHWFPTQSVPLRGWLYTPWKSICLTQQRESHCLGAGEENLEELNLDVLFGRFWCLLSILSSIPGRKDHCNQWFNIQYTFCFNFLWKTKCVICCCCCLSKYQISLFSFLVCEKLYKLIFIKLHITLFFWFSRKWPSVLHEKACQTFNDK